MKLGTFASWEQVAVLFRSHKLLVARFFATALGRAIAQMLVVLLIQRFLSGALGHGASRPGLVGRLAAAWGPSLSLLALGGVLLVCQLAGSACNYASNVAQLRIGKVIELGMLERLIRHLLSLSVPFFDRQSHGDIIQAVRTDITQLRLTVRALCSIVLEALLAAFLLAGAISIDPRLALWSLAVVPAAALPIFLLAKRALASSYKVRKTGYLLSDIVLQILRGVRIIKAYRTEARMAENSLEKGRLYFDVMIEDLGMRSLAGVVMETLAGFVVVSIIVGGGLEVLRGETSWPSLLAFVMAVRAMYGPINNINMHYVEMRSMGASVQRLADILATAPEVTDRPGAAPLEAPPRTIAFERVSFSYGERPVLEDVSFEVMAGETIGVVGPSGGGKSTLLGLLARFYDPGSGRVLFDGRDLRDIRLDDVYAKMALVTQEPFLFATSVRENIRAGRPEASEAEVEAAARAAYVHEEILALPSGYDTAVGMGGRELSGGQRQRLSIARALLTNAPILLLDEATSSLDSVAEAEVQRAVDELMAGRTSFVIAHRLSTLRNADRILVLAEGRLAGFGTHAELLRSSAVYRLLWDTQQLERAPSEAVAGAAA